MGFRSRLVMVICLLILVFGTVRLSGAEVNAIGDSVDEVHYSYGDSPDSVIFNWHGTETILYYGLDTNYGSQAVAQAPSIIPANDAGPLKEVKLTGLQPNTQYYYRIGSTGLDHVFNTIPTSDFNWVDIGDTMSTYCGNWMAAQNQLILDQSPNFVTHGGDIAVPNQCGLPSIHSFYNDIQTWSFGAAFQPVWGNHEYGAPQAGAPSNAITDTLSNYKGRSYITNAQTVPVDTPYRTTAPGCGKESGSTRNLCQGEDWGWFHTGNVLFISYPEPWAESLADWKSKADVLMASAQNDPSTDFIVTYGHRPAYTTNTLGPTLKVRDAVNALALKYSPTVTNSSGKYVLNVAHHAHGIEVFKQINGLTNIVAAAGGQGLLKFTTTDPNLLYRIMHFGILSAQYNEATHSLKVNLLCGADGPNQKDSCAYGTNLYQQTFTRPDTTPPPASLGLAYGDNVSVVQSGDELTYSATVTNKNGHSDATNVMLATTVPSNSEFVRADDYITPANGSLTWNIGTLAGGQTIIKRFTVRVGAVSPNDHVLSNVTVTADGTACSEPGSVCTASDDNTIPPPAPSTIQYITNQSFEVDKTGWTGLYNATSLATRITTDSYDGIASIKMTNTSASTWPTGINSKPKPILSTVAGLKYSGSAWVKGQIFGQNLSLMLRETKPDGTIVGSASVSIAATSSGWDQLVTDYIAKANGNHLEVRIYSLNVASKAWYLVDMTSLTTPSNQ
ncbi:MAG: fibronectin type III domain-containing protein [Candidatus Saccharimonadales bacterium]